MKTMRHLSWCGKVRHEVCCGVSECDCGAEPLNEYIDGLEKENADLRIKLEELESQPALVQADIWRNKAHELADQLEKARGLLAAIRLPSDPEPANPERLGNGCQIYSTAKPVTE